MQNYRCSHPGLIGVSVKVSLLVENYNKRLLRLPLDLLSENVNFIDPPGKDVDEMITNDKALGT